MGRSIGSLHRNMGVPTLAKQLLKAWLGNGEHEIGGAVFEPPKFILELENTKLEARLGSRRLHGRDGRGLTS
mgnify:CR=1 FL=1